MLLWQGSPDWRVIARRVLHLRAVAVYFSVLLIIRGVLHLDDGHAPVDVLVSTLWLLPFVACALALIAALGWAIARTTVYSITNRRVIMRIGVALPMTLNLPFAVIESAALRRHGDGTGDIPLVLGGPDRIAYLHLWPHARPWEFTRPQPALRALPDATGVAAVLTDAITAYAGPALVRSGSEKGRDSTAGTQADDFRSGRLGEEVAA